MKPVKRLLLLCTALWLVNIVPALAGYQSADDNTGRDDTQVFHIYKDVDLVSTLKYAYGRNPHYFVKAVYPQLEGDMDNTNIDDFNRRVITLIQDEIASFQNQVINKQDTANTSSKAKNNLYLDYDTSTIKSNGDHIISVRFTIQGFIAGMAHPYHHHRVMNYDLETGETIELADLFREHANYLAAFADYTSHYLYKRLPDKDLLLAGTAPKAENFINWNIKPTGILITFEEYQVAPYVNGAQTVLVPYAVLKKIMHKDSPIADCVNHRSRCLRSNLLTGGFMDEAINTRHRALNPVLGKL